MAIVGFLEFADNSSVRGWAYDSELPSAHLEIVVRIGDKFCESGFADIRRHDLAAEGIGDGSHGFSIDLSAAQITADDAAGLNVHAVSGAETVELSRAEIKTDRIIELISEPSTPVSDETQFPVFILGPARSGTSAITLGLLGSGRYVGTGEGHLLPLAYALLATIDRYYQGRARDAETSLGRVPVAGFQKFIRRGFVQLMRDLFPTAYWLDKTPTVEMVRATPLMQELWPNARFIFMKRRVIENVLSRQRKFPDGTTDQHYSDWAAVMTAWLAVREKLAGAALEVEHRQVILDPEAAASSIVEFLDMPDAAAKALQRYLASTRPEQTDQNFGATYTFEHLSLNDDEARHMKAICDPLMTAYGYSYDDSYFASANSTGSKIPA